MTTILLNNLTKVQSCLKILPRKLVTKISFCGI